MTEPTRTNMSTKVCNCSTLDIQTVVTLVTVTEVTVVTLDRNKHVYKTWQQFVSAIGITKDVLGHGSKAFFTFAFCLIKKIKSKKKNKKN